MAKLRIDRKSFTREAYTRKGGIKVSRAKIPRTIFMAKDRGAPNRGPKIIKIKREGRFGEGFFSMPKEKQYAILSRDAKKYGEKSTMGAMSAISVFNKRTNKPLSRKASQLRSWIAPRFEGKVRRR